MVSDKDKPIEIKEYIKQLDKDLNQVRETLNYIMEQLGV
jgi:hypothetical protein